MSYEKSQLEEEINSSLDKLRDSVINIIKEAYGDVKNTLAYCEKLVTHDDEFIRKMRFIILAIKLYPADFSCTCHIDINFGGHNSARSQTVVEFNKIKQEVSNNDAGIYEPIGELENNGHKNILHDGEYIAQLIEGKASIIDYIGTSYKLLIPASIEGKPVNAIGNYAFCSKGINQIGLPVGLSSIGDNAFSNNFLTEINILSSVTSIGKCAFEHNNLVRANVPSGVVRIPENAFNGNVLTTLELAEGITCIGYFAFKDNSLEKVKIPDSVKKMYYGVFVSNPLKEITLPANIEIIQGGDIEENIYKVYKNNNRRAGIYRQCGGNWEFINGKY